MRTRYYAARTAGVLTTVTIKFAACSKRPPRPSAKEQRARRPSLLSLAVLRTPQPPRSFARLEPAEDFFSAAQIPITANVVVSHMPILTDSCSAYGPAQCNAASAGSNASECLWKHNCCRGAWWWTHRERQRKPAHGCLGESLRSVKMFKTASSDLTIAAHHKEGRIDSVGLHILEDGYWEWHSVAEMLTPPEDLKEKEWIAPDPSTSVFLDIGGNIGALSFLYAAAGWRVISIEPMVHNRRAIEATIHCLNPSLPRLGENIKVFPRALSAHGGSGNCVGTSTVRNSGNAVLTCGAAVKRLPHAGNCTKMLDRLACGVPERLLAQAIGTCEIVQSSTLDDVLATVRSTLPTAWHNIRAVKMCVSRSRPFDLSPPPCLAFSLFANPEVKGRRMEPSCAQGRGRHGMRCTQGRDLALHRPQQTGRIADRDQHQPQRLVRPKHRSVAWVPPARGEFNPRPHRNALSASRFTGTEKVSCVSEMHHRLTHRRDGTVSRLLIHSPLALAHGTDSGLHGCSSAASSP